jgi:hypothetical protein
MNIILLGSYNGYQFELLYFPVAVVFDICKGS